MAERRARRHSFAYVPAEHLAGRRHVIVDGAPRAGTVCTLSHWPATPTPEALWHDVSAGIVRRALAGNMGVAEGADAVSVDHYDADGVIALALLCVEGLADEHGELLVDAARAGDFDVVTRRHAAQVAFALRALYGGDDVDGVAALLDVAPPGSGADRTAWAATQALWVLPALAEDPERHRALWSAEYGAFEASGAALAQGWATIEERPERDLAIVRVDVGHGDASAAAWAGAPLHRGAVHSATDCLRVATVARGAVEVRYRYESWVRLESRRPRPRVDLGAAASELTRAETAGGRWVFDGAGAITGALHLADGDVTTLDPGHVLDVVGRHLDELDAGPAAWDPYA